MSEISPINVQENVSRSEDIVEILRKNFKERGDPTPENPTADRPKIDPYSLEGVIPTNNTNSNPDAQNRFDQFKFSKNCVQDCHRPAKSWSDFSTGDFRLDDFGQKNPFGAPQKTQSKTINDLSPKDVKTEIEKITNNENISSDLPLHFDTTKPTVGEKSLETSIEEEGKKAKPLDVLDSSITKYSEDAKRHTKAFDQQLRSNREDYETSDKYWTMAKQSQSVANTLTEIKTAANGNDQMAIDLIQKRLDESPAPELEYPLKTILKDSYNEARLEGYKKELNERGGQRENLTVDKLLESVSKTSGVDERLLANRALANLTGDPKHLLPYFPVLQKKLAEGKVSESDLMAQIKDLAQTVKGGYIGEGKNISNDQANNPDALKKNTFDQSTRFMVAAAWLTTRPDDQLAMKLKDDKISLPSAVYSMNGNYELQGNTSSAGSNRYNHTLIQNYRNEDNIETTVHEFVHQRDRRSNSQSLIQVGLDGYMHNSNQIQGLVQYRQMFGAKLDSGIIPSEEVFGVGRSIINSSAAELAARTDTAFLTGSKEFQTYASELKLPGQGLSFYDSLVRYYGVDPLRIH